MGGASSPCAAAGLTLAGAAATAVMKLRSASALSSSQLLCVCFPRSMEMCEGLFFALSRLHAGDVAVRFFSSEVAFIISYYLCLSPHLSRLVSEHLRFVASFASPSSLETRS